MDKIENLEICIWKEIQLDKNSTTFQDVSIGNKLYRCIGCDGLELNKCEYYRHIKRDYKG